MVGYVPEWLNDEVVKLPIEDKFNQKHQNIMANIFYAIEKGAVKGEFMYSSDDHFTVKPIDLDAYPYFYKRARIRSILELSQERAGINNYRRSLAGTRLVLETEGYGAVEYCGHVNTHMRTEEYAEVRRICEKYHNNDFGFEPTCMFMNVRMRRDAKSFRTEPVYRKDSKITYIADKVALERMIGARDTFSISDKAFEWEGFADFMEEVSGGKKSPWER